MQIESENILRFILIEFNYEKFVCIIYTSHAYETLIISFDLKKKVLKCHISIEANNTNRADKELIFRMYQLPCFGCLMKIFTIWMQKRKKNTKIKQMKSLQNKQTNLPLSITQTSISFHAVLTFHFVKRTLNAIRLTLFYISWIELMWLNHCKSIFKELS